MRQWLIAAVVAAVAVPAAAAPFTAELTPSADAFVRAAAPTSNYGGGGGLSVAGSAATNGFGEVTGKADTFLRFDLSGFVADATAHFGTLEWWPTRAVLKLTEQAAPPHPVFGRGVGQFEVRWVVEDHWEEGTGKPNKPKTDGVAWQDEFSILNPQADLTLGVFSNTGADGELAFELRLPEPVVADIEAGGDVSFLLTAVDHPIGFTFNSRSIKPPRTPPVLELTADIPEPTTLGLLAVGGLVAARRRRS
jgi:hypothetical protein